MVSFISNFDISAIGKVLAYDPSSPLLFNTGLFLIIFIAFIFIYELLRNYPTAKMIATIAFSLYFYYKSSAECCFILLGICLCDYILGNLLGRVREHNLRKGIVALNVVLNIGMLIYFKYFNLLASTWASMWGQDFDILDIVLPAGISFITFRSISYIVDVYRGQMEPERNLLYYTFSLTFFPPLLAGPVVRAKDLLPQVNQNPVASPTMISEGFFLIMIGLFKKVIIADYLSGNFVNRIFENPTLYSGFENLIGCIGFTIQIYCDFSGYSDMAIGLALLMGYRFKLNFNAPFKSQNPSEFWRRWHISLSTWLRDYLYIPLGGNRRGKARTYLNNFITMVLGGIWHGAGWMYLMWGAYQGALLAIHKAIKSWWKTPEFIKGSSPTRIFNIALTFTLTVIGFTIFRASSPQNLSEIIGQIFSNFHGDIAPQFISAYFLIVVAMLVALVMHFLPGRWTESVKNMYADLPLVSQGLILAAFIFFVIQTRSSDLVPFIYLQY